MSRTTRRASAASIDLAFRFEDAAKAFQKIPGNRDDKAIARDTRVVREPDTNIVRIFTSAGVVTAMQIVGSAVAMIMALTDDTTFKCTIEEDSRTITVTITF